MIDKIITIQSKLKVPKGQYNSFGKYSYRSCEDILEAVKPLLIEEKILMTITDEVVNIGNRNYVKATIILSDGTNSISNCAYAREDEVKKGMSGDQITGASSSYARKYALNGMFAIDDTKDSDFPIEEKKSKEKKEEPKEEKKMDTPYDKLTFTQDDFDRLSENKDMFASYDDAIKIIKEKWEVSTEYDLKINGLYNSDKMFK